MKYLIITFIVLFFTFSVNGAEKSITVIDSAGNVQILYISFKIKEWQDLKPGMKVNPRDIIRTGKESTASLKIENYELIINPATVIEAVDFSTNYIFRVRAGSIRVRGKGSPEKIKILVGKSVITPEGTEFIIEYNPSEDKTKVYTEEGKVKVKTKEEEIEVKKGEKAEIEKEKIISKPEKITPEETKKIEQIKQAPVVAKKKEMEKKKKKKKKPALQEEKKEEKPWCEKPVFNWDFSIDVQYMYVDKSPHIYFALMPEFEICKKIGLGFYLPVIYNWKYNFLNPGESWYNYHDWDFIWASDFFHDLLIKFIYVRYGNKKEGPVYIRLGSLPSVTLGNGFIMYRYSNMMQFPFVRRLGLEGRYIYKRFIGIDIFVSDLSRSPFYAVRVFGRPLTYFLSPQSRAPWKYSEAGISIVYDPNIGNKERVIHYGLDFSIPILTLKMLNLKYTLDWASASAKSSVTGNQYKQQGWGFSTGLKGSLLFFGYKAEYRLISDGYKPEYFDETYDSMRQTYLDRLLYNNQNYNGFFAQIKLNILKQFNIGGEFQEYYGKEGDVSNEATVFVTLPKGVIPRVYGKGKYIKRNIVGLTGDRGLFGPIYNDNTVITFDGYVMILPVLYLKVYYEKSFQRDENGNLVTYETINTGISLQFSQWLK